MTAAAYRLSEQLTATSSSSSLPPSSSSVAVVAAGGGGQRRREHVCELSSRRADAGQSACNWTPTGHCDMSITLSSPARIRRSPPWQRVQLPPQPYRRGRTRSGESGTRLEECASRRDSNRIPCPSTKRDVILGPYFNFIIRPRRR